jgi:transcriptional accessory protein Tex/SPT6
VTLVEIHLKNTIMVTFVVVPRDEHKVFEEH